MKLDLNNKEELKKLIENDELPCYERYGFRWKGASSSPITKEKALKLLPKFSPGMGFYELCEETVNGKQSLVFVEYSESDML